VLGRSSTTQKLKPALVLDVDALTDLAESSYLDLVG
jgi:hypothetical protein